MAMTTPPGWYPDPAAPALERWWDGGAWSGSTRRPGTGGAGAPGSAPAPGGAATPGPYAVEAGGAAASGGPHPVPGGTASPGPYAAEAGGTAVPGGPYPAPGGAAIPGGYAVEAGGAAAPGRPYPAPGEAASPGAYPSAPGPDGAAPGGFGPAGFGPAAPGPYPGNPYRDLPVAGPYGGTAQGHPAAAAAPGRGRRRVGPVLLAAMAVAAAVTLALVLLRPGDEPGDGPGGTTAPAPTGSAGPTATGVTSAPSPETGGADDGSEGEPTALTDQLNGITVPILDGWEKPEFSSSEVPLATTTATDDCPASSWRSCPRGSVNSRTAATAGDGSPAAIARADIAEAAEEAFGEDPLGNRPYGGIRSHQVVAERSVSVAGRTGHLVRWRVTTEQGPGGHIQSVVFPSPVGSEAPVAVRIALSAAPGSPPLTTMDRITDGIRPIGDATGGGVGSSIGP
ncbi:DUF2510 domain-containing protein [Streptomyces sp. NPDC046887]|uniref:DUF2510 domain-containing protein n=1 Tax=Streptomyces sp. NPDC046887 TaxID=3155472 RepID=UPI003407835B